MRKLVLDLSIAQIVPEKINKMFLTKKLGFIDVLSTVKEKNSLSEAIFIFVSYALINRGKMKTAILKYIYKLQNKNPIETRLSCSKFPEAFA